nr:hypothetical protein [Kibdelosporangium sp. MJ126-NF4]CTQ98918.1 hypothetical protein [Kibdelosporangium sp. MJ126-NF4]
MFRLVDQPQIGVPQQRIAFPKLRIERSTRTFKEPPALTTFGGFSKVS